MSTNDTPLDRVLAALTVRAHESELTGRDRALAAFREAAANPLPATRREPMNKSTLARLLTVKVGVAALCVTVLGGVAVAAGTDHLPVPGRHPGHPARHGVPELKPKLAPVSASPTGTPTARPTPSGHPDPRLAAICERLLHEKKYTKSRAKEHARDRAYAALVQAAGGEDRVLAYCAALVPPGAKPKPAPKPKPATTPSHKAKTPKPAHPGKTVKPSHISKAKK